MHVNPVLGEIVERNSNSPGPNGCASSSALRPIRAVVGTAFPGLREDRSYSARPPQSVSSQNLSSSFRHSSGAAQDPPPLPVEPAQEQWDPRDLDGLRRGYYKVPPPLLPPDDALLCGEAYVDLWLRFMRSAVPRHRELAVEALRERCPHDTDLRHRCLRGPGSAQLLHFLIRGGLASGHTVTCRTAAECLSHILFDAAEEVTEAVGEIAVPPTDAMDDKDNTHETCLPQGSDVPELNTDAEAGEPTYAELSSWLRTDDDRARALERLCLSATVMNAVPVLSAPLVARVLLGAHACTVSGVARRMATDPRYIHSVAERVGRVVLGHIALSEMAEELLLLRRVLHVRAAADVLIPHLREPLVLLVHYISTTPTTDTTETVGETVALLALFLTLRAAVRHGLSGVFTDATDALLARGAMSRGAGIPAEMWLLARADTASVGIAAVAEEFAREALHEVNTVLPPHPVREGEGHDELRQEEEKCSEDKSKAGATVEEPWTALLAGAGAMHYLATYFTVVGGDSLLGSSADTRRALRRRLLTADCLRRAFIRCDATNPEPRALTTVMREALWASLAHGRVRLAAALDERGSSDDATIAFAAAMASRFEIKCMGLTSVAGHLLPDELCTMIEIVGIMRRGGSQFAREALVAEIFVMQSIFLTKHGLDAAPALVASALGECVGSPTSLSPSASLSELAESFSRALEQMQWPWVIYPLYDTVLETRSTWAAWVRRALGADQRVKHVLQWDTLLAHTLAWAVGHHDAVADVHALLEELCAGLLPNAGVPFSPAACAAMRGLTTSTPPHAEAPMPKMIAEAIAVAATVCEPSVATALVRLIASATVDSSAKKESEEEKCDSRCGAVLSCWAHTGRLGETEGTAVLWDVENFAELLQGAAGDEWAREDAMGLRIARQVAEGIAELYVRQHGSLSTFEVEVVRSSVDVMRWCPSAICNFI